MYRLLIWGTGRIASRLIEHVCYENAIVEGIIDTNKLLEEWMGFPVFLPETVSKNYDFIIVANSFTDEIVHKCMELDIDLRNVIFFRGLKSNPGCKDRGIIRKILDDSAYNDLCVEYDWKEYSFFEKDAITYSKMNIRRSFEIDRSTIWPILTDRYAEAGQVNNYFLQDLWGARLIARSGAKEHFDIGSRLDGFIAHLLSMDIKVTMIDVRRFPCKIEGLNTIVADATMLDGIGEESIDSLSALCSLEHFGLGRYGDPIDPEACFKCFRSISRVMKEGGNLYISVPIGKERVEFNAHRVFYPETIISEFSEFELLQFACAADEKFEYDVDIHKYDNDQHHGNYRYGLFYFKKRKK